MKICEAIGCQIHTKRFMCGPHIRLLSKEIKQELFKSNYAGQSCIDAIEYVAERERKDIGSLLLMTLKERYLGE